ncbi:MAG: M23 family metallopeptidase [Verrucomicrobiae bacterium]|nr:M23 family metallopeptidase [Verrucomicrobiae bacterium]
MNLICSFLVFVVLGGVIAGSAEVFQFPTANRALLDGNGTDRFFVATPGRTWESGSYGCVRSDGHQLHEGVDIRCLERDSKGEPTDTVMSTAEGVVVYVNRRPELSNYGNYLVVQHNVEGIEVFSLYAHLAEIRTSLRPGVHVRAGEKLGVMGRTSNTRTQISKERAHLHFEIALRLSDSFTRWFRERYPNLRNDHGEWNGQNLIGLDVVNLLREQARLGSGFSIHRFIATQKELCRVQVRATRFDYLGRYRAFVRDNPGALAEGIAGYELTLNYAGLPFVMVPRAASEMKNQGRFVLISVNAPEQAAHPCGKLVVKRGSTWTLASNGERLLDLLTY